MTTVAYRDGLMATDSQATLNNTTILPGESKKVWRLADGSIAAGAGNAFTIAGILSQAKAATEIKTDSYISSVLSVDASGTVRVHENGATIEVRNAPFFAIGSGAPAAIAAMHCGATAEEAVQAAIKVDVFSSGAVQTIRVEPGRCAPASEPSSPAQSQGWRSKLSRFFWGEFP